MLSVHTQDSNQQPLSSRAYSLMLEASKDSNLIIGASCLAVRRGEIFFQASVGSKEYQDQDPITESTVFDLGSLTGSLVTCTLVMQAIAEERLKLNDRVSKYLQNFGVLGKASITVAHLLSHTAGLPHHYSFQKDLPDLSSTALVGAKTVKGSKEALYNAINRMSLKAEPGIRHQWSEIGWLVLGLLTESVYGSELDELAEKRIFRPLRLKSTHFLNQDKLSKLKLSVDKQSFAASGKCPVRSKEIRATPFDFVTNAIGGVSGHSGLFSNSFELAILGNELLNCCKGNGILLPKELAALFSYAESEARIAYNHGWQDMASSPEFSKAKFSKKAFGRASLLGPAVLIDPEQDLIISLTANRRNPTEVSKRFENFRSDLVASLIEVASFIESTH